MKLLERKNEEKTSKTEFRKRTNLRNSTMEYIEIKLEKVENAISKTKKQVKLLEQKM